MKRKFFIVLILMLSFSLLTTGLFAQEKKNEKASKDTTKTEAKPEKKKKKPKEPKFEELIEEYEKIDGLFPLYYSEKEGKVYMEIKPEHFGPVYLCNITRQSGDAYLFDSGAMIGEFPFFLRKIGKKIQFIEKNVAFRASPDVALRRALEKNIPNSIWASAKIASQPHPERGSVLIDAAAIFLKDRNWVTYITGKLKMPYNFDKENSFFSDLKSFPLNTEIEVTLHFKSNKPSPLFTLPDTRSMLHRYHYSISALPETDYQPRFADDRVGHFLTIFQDYSSLLEDTPYKRYITRWQLEKAEPKFKLTKPKKPIVYWLENTIPVEYRDAVREGILLWNKAFEKIGFQDAIEVRQMPDDAEWDPADVRYSTVRWIVQPGGGYAVGPSRANPFTGQIYDADIRVSADFVRFYYREFDEFITPLSWMDVQTDGLWPFGESHSTLPSSLPYQCNYARGMTHQMAFGWNLLLSRGMVSDNSEDLKKFIHDGIVDLIVHEVGHTLGLRHNFKASSTINFDKLGDKDFTAKTGISGSVMDYNPINVSARGEAQGNYFQTTLGPYDYWAIEYAYKPLDPESKMSEKEMLEKIASKVADPKLQYGTDEDAFGFSTRGIDPTCNLWDLGNEPLLHFQKRIQLAKELWQNIPKKFEKKGERYQKFRLVFNQGLREYAIAAALVPKYIGGIYSYRDHIGDPDGRIPFRVVPAEKQRQALDFLTQNLFSPGAFRLPPDLLNKLVPERFWDFEGTVWRMTRIDYPIHGVIQAIQASALFRLYDPLVLLRMQDNELRFNKGEKPFTMAEMFRMVQDAIWQELAGRENINSFRRELQRMHLHLLTKLVVKTPVMIPHDAVTLARANLLKIREQIDENLESGSLDTYTTAHLQETAAKIDAALKAQIQQSF